MMFKNIFITGASTGIGAALSKLYAGTGITLGLVSRETTALDAVADECRAKGAIVWTYTADVTNAALMKQCAGDFYGKTRSIDLVIANAGIRLEEDTDFSDPTVPARVMETNYMGVINTVVPFIPFMKENKSGTLAVISSIAAFRGTPNSGAYSASKAAVNLWTESLRLRLYPSGIKVCTLCLGFVQTAMTAGLPFNMPGIITAPQAAQLIARSVRQGSRTATFPWQSKYIWLVFRILPGRFYDKLILWKASKHKKN